jgi:Bacterial protein of unknown function (DUF885)
MISRDPSVLLMTVCLLAGALGGRGTSSASPPPGGYEDLVAFYKDFRAFQKPKLVGGVPDYSAAAMAAQQKALEGYKTRLAGIDPSGWPIPQQVDYQIVRAEVSSLDFDHRVLKPWANNPGYYVTFFPEESDQPKREGPFAEGAIELWSYKQPLSKQDAAKVDAGLRAIPGLLAQAKTNLTGSGRDLWVYGTKALKQQSKELADFATTDPTGLQASVDRAKNATDELTAWLDTQAPSKNGPSGIGIENYDWYLKHVQLVPLNWQEEVALHQRELARSRSMLAMEEIRNASLPPQIPVASKDEYDRKFRAALAEYMAFLKDKEILTVKAYMEPALRARLGSYQAGPLEFFSEVDYRDPVPMRAHGYHWFDKAWMIEEPPASPIRRDVRLHNLDNTRTEGLATAWEELTMQAGILDARPRSRELVYILVAQRAARALGELFMVANIMTIEQAAAFACANTPRGWLDMKGNLVRGEQHLYLQQPGYGTSYLTGKWQLDELIAERRRQQGDAFRMKAFMDDFNSRGLIPMSLIQWEMTGEKSPQVERMLKP